MKTIYKYALSSAGGTGLILRGPVLSAGVQGDDIMVWAIHDDDEPERGVRISIRGTGHAMVGNEGEFLGTVFLGPFVFHVFVAEVEL